MDQPLDSMEGIPVRWRRKGGEGGGHSKRHICKTVIPVIRRTMPLILLLSLLSSLLKPILAYPQFSEQTAGLSPQNIAVDSQSGAVYVGSINRVYRLDSNLTVEAAMVTGPVLDSPECYPGQIDCLTKTMTDNVNKVLIADDDRLIVCGTIYQGVCDILSADTLGILYNSSTTEISVNTEYGTTVAFVGDGPSNMKTLYVGSSTSQWLRGSPWTVSSRQLPSDLSSPDLFRVYNGQQVTATNPSQIAIPPETISRSPPSQIFNISYVAGFAAGGFSYFVAIQPQIFDSPSEYFTKIARVCQQDDHFYSYIELPLQCSVQSGSTVTLYNLAQSAYLGTVGSDLGSSTLQPGTDVLFVLFAKSDGMTDIPDAESAVCMYPLSAIDTEYWRRRLGCANRETHRTDIDWSGSTECRTSADMKSLINRTGPGYCHLDDSIHPLGGQNHPIEARAIYTHSSSLTSVAATVHRSETVIFLGDQDGNLKKLRLKDAATAELYEEMEIDSDGGMVRNGMVLTPDQDHLYVMTETKITKVPVEECETYTTFNDCLRTDGGVSDPFCGWCTLLKRCTRGVEEECPGVSNSSAHRWLSGSDENVEIIEVSPPNTESGTETELTLTVRNLPTLSTGGSYQCVFGELGVNPAVVNVLRTQSTSEDLFLVTCFTPTNIPPPTDGFTRVELSLRATETGVDIVSHEFFFFMCGTFSSCTQCVMQDFGCNWCGYENTCTVNSDTCEPQGVVYGVGASTNAPTDDIGPDACPRVGLGDRTEVLIPTGMRQAIQLDAANLPPPLAGADNEGYECVFEYEDQTLIIPAKLHGVDHLQCENHTFEYARVEGSVDGALNVRWNGASITENSLPVVLYKCSVNRPNCGLCLSADPKFQCGWCTGNFQCSSEKECPSDWIMGGQAVCPDPTIRQFHPRSGHVTGGTYLTIYGYNLGLMADDISRITVAGYECDIDRSSYVTALQISCTTERADRPKPGKIVVEIGVETYTATSNTSYRYVLPKITGVEPAYGPMSGGSVVSILGFDLDAGSSSFANLVNIPCQIISAAPSEVVCMSGPARTNSSGAVSMTVDNHYVEGVSTFTYRPDPVIDRVNRFSGISSGSVNIVVDGQGFETIQQPQIIFNVGAAQLVSNCNPIGTGTVTRLECPTPSISDLNMTLPLRLPVANVSLRLDGVAEYNPLQNNGRISGLADAFMFYQDPVYYMFEEEQNIRQFKFEDRKYLEILGTNLKLAYKEGDVRVTVGGAECTDVVVQPTRLACSAPERANTTREGQNLLAVKVKHGNLTFDIGYVEYLPQAIPLALIVGSVAGGILFLLFLLIMAVCVASYRKNHNNEKKFKQIEEQRDALELQVAQECKEAFAELQTGVLSFTHDIKGFGIPFLDYRTYVVKSLFPDNPNHAVLRELSVAGVRKDYVHKGLWQFGQLLANKSFLMIFVRVLEEQRTLSTRDLSNVASLLVVAFQGKMEYCTDVLKALMARAIRQHVREGEGSARVFMRRGVSVVEKMAGHWLSVLLYTHLREAAGEALFKLFYAIKQQVEKGPVDAVTGEARYSLTEGKLIRQQVEVKQLTLKAQGPDRNTKMVEVKVLDCDTISQTKDKILDAIYKTSPFSQRPHKDEVDLEWYDREEGKLLLFDDDGLRPLENGWRRLNTLSHYRVPDGATVFLLQTQGSSGSLHSNHSSPARSYVNVNVNIHPTLSSSMSPIITLDYENSNRVWHLVKPEVNQALQNGVNDRKMMAEIYLPRLLTTKTILQKFVDDVMTTVFMMNTDGTSPLAIKYLFDFLDDQAHENGVTDPSIIHAWKSNCLPLRFWVNLIKNPDMIFDIHKADTVDSCLSVVAQCVMEACSVSEQVLNKNSPASKLLYAKDIPNYKEYVSQYYKDIRNEPVVSDQDMNSLLAQHSQEHHYDFYTLSALNELYFGYACKYRSELISALDEDATAVKQGHAEKIEDIERIMSKSF
ncbi:plexin-A2-like [Diadema antillarum]|uniref:plexin-A2-like n=1 Tax=Diadema antillarum TaxID=105358 RepID=UPI003A8A3CAB